MGDGGVAVGDHVRPIEASRDGHDGRVPDGIYRVVGTDEDSVTLLLVGDAAGRRWSLWLLGRSIRSRPVPSAVAIAFLLVGALARATSRYPRRR